MPARLYVLALALLIQGTTAADATGGNAEADLEALRTRIQSIESEMVSGQERTQSLLEELKRSEIRVGKNAKRIKSLNSDVGAKLKQLKRLKTEKAEHQISLKEERALLSNQIRSAYQMGRQDFLKILLNQQDPYAISRCLTYHDYFNKARAHRIDGVLYSLNQISSLAHAISDETNRLQKLRDRTLAQQSDFRSQRRGRELVLAKLQKSMYDQSQQLDRLKENERELESLIAELGRNPTQLITESEALIPFSDLKGHLPWPTIGRLKSRYGSPRQSGAMKWRGVMIAADNGHDIQAISHGKVVFADWLRHFGLIIIIDHGNGYMSLYGHNQALFKEVGNWVESGEIIASVGDSGGHSESGLYFEIRNQGRPEDPVLWCKAENN